ncbi:hypothetical protein PG984_007817 [Apiospora sp. TS-2023a]
MHVFSPTTALLAACAMGGVRAASPTSGVIELDLAFPRNQTYAPAARLPIVFGYQNPELATALNARVSFVVWNLDDMRNSVVTSSFDLGQAANLSSRDPFLQYEYFPGFEAEGRWLLTWTVGWDNCTKDSLELTNTGKRITHQTTTQSVRFATKDSAPEIDLAAATDNKDCPQEMGLAFDVTATLKVPSWAKGDWSGGDQCAKVAESMPKPSPCRVQIDAAAASSMAASMTAKACAHKDVAPPKGVECPPDEKSSAQQLVVTGIACLAATMGAFGFVLM